MACKIQQKIQEYLRVFLKRDFADRDFLGLSDFCGWLEAEFVAFGKIETFSLRVNSKTLRFYARKENGSTLDVELNCTQDEHFSYQSQLPNLQDPNQISFLEESKDD